MDKLGSLGSGRPMSATVVVQIGSSVDPFCKSLGKSSGVGVKKFLQMIRSSIMLKEGYSPFRVYKIGYWNHFGAISSYWLPMLLKQKCHPARIQRNSQMSIASSWSIQEEKTGVCGLVVSERSVCLSRFTTHAIYKTLSLPCNSSSLHLSHNK